MTAMFQASLTYTDLPSYVWPEDELAQFNAHVAGLPTWTPLATSSSTAPIGHNGPPSDHDRPDPLAGMTKKQIFVDCIWLSDEGPTTKLVLLCISRFFNPDASASSMAYSQIEADCSLSDRAVKGAVADAESDDTAPDNRKAVRKGAQAARERWLLIERGKGFRTASGPQNLYHGIVPERWVAKLRELRSRGVSVEADERIVRAADAATAGLKGVQQDHPLDPRGESGASKGCRRFTLTPITPTKKERQRGANAPSLPLNAPVTQSTNGSGGVQPQQGTPSAAPHANNRGAAREGKAEAAAAPSDFDRFWNAFPPGRKLAKAEARDLFNQIASGKHKTRRATAAEMIAAAERYAATKPDPKYTPAPTRWLNGGRWEDDDAGNADGGRPQSAPTDPATFDAATWRLLLRHMSASRKWPPEYGPPPGDPDCLVPPEILEDYPHLTRLFTTEGSTQ